MDRRMLQNQPLSRDQVAAILRQRAERHVAAPEAPPAAIAGNVMAQGAAGGVLRMPLLPPAAQRRDEGGAAPGLPPAFGLRQYRDQPPFYRQATLSSSSSPPASDDMVGFGVRLTNVILQGDVVSFQPAQAATTGMYLESRPLSEAKPYFEVEIVEKGSVVPHIIVGLCSARYPSDVHPGWASESIGYHTGDGSLYRGRPRGQPYGPSCDVGDRIGCGIRVTSPSTVNVFFTKNGKEIGTSGTGICVALPPGGLCPAIGFQNAGEEVAVLKTKKWLPLEEDMMLVDGGEDDWPRLHDIKINGQVLEYVGRGKSLVDVGLAQAKTPICTRNHYFEMEIVDPGKNCYIAIGLARKDYPKNRHPGWNKGSIAYRADDGKVFLGSGVGAPFGPRCHKGDVMGCGVLFPRNYECKSDSEEELEQQGGGQQAQALADRAAAAAGQQQQGQYGQIDDFVIDSGDEGDDWWNDQVFVQSGVKVQIYFTRNDKVIGKKDVRIPKGGFYPTIGMMSSREKVRVDLRPLSG